jgi:hypothetical protein
MNFINKYQKHNLGKYSYLEPIINSNIDNFVQFGKNNNYKILKIHVGDSQPVDSFIVYEKI